MAKPVVWIPRRLSDATIPRARRDHEVILTTDDQPTTADGIVAMSARIDAVIPAIPGVSPQRWSRGLTPG